jgi:hypothetical protein
MDRVKHKYLILKCICNVAKVFLTKPFGFAPASSFCCAPLHSYRANGTVLSCVKMIEPGLIDLKRFQEEESAFGFNDFFRVVSA